MQALSRPLLSPAARRNLAGVLPGSSPGTLNIGSASVIGTAVDSCALAETCNRGECIARVIPPAWNTVWSVVAPFRAASFREQYHKQQHLAGASEPEASCEALKQHTVKAVLPPYASRAAGRRNDCRICMQSTVFSEPRCKLRRRLW